MTATAPPTGTPDAPDDGTSIDIVLYSELEDTTPQPRTMPWGDLADALHEHDERETKDGPGWSATVYRKKKTRGKAGVEKNTALVLDVDHEEPLWSLLDGLEYVAHTTWKHHASDDHEGCRGRSDCPHWRIVLPLARPVVVTEWDKFRTRARFWLCPNADESAKDAPRFFWLPACQPGKDRAARRTRGRWLDPDELKPVPDDEPATRKTVGFGPVTDGDERPGDRFNREADWCRDILPTWKPVGTHGDNLMMKRPGSTNSHGATISKRGQGVLFVFTDQAAPLQVDTCYTKFGAYATLEHGGDFKAAAKALAERYGMHSRGPTVDWDDEEITPPGRNAHGPPNGDVPTGGDTLSDRISRPGHRPCTDLGNAERLIDRFGSDLLYSKLIGDWLVWDGRRWKIDTAHRVVRLAKETVRGIYHEAAEAETKEQRRDLAAWGRRSEAAARIESMISLARSSVPVDPGELDRNPWLINVRNGTVDLRDGQLQPHRREDVITKLIDVVYDPEAPRARWEQFLAEILPAEAVRRFIKRAAGYSATGSARERKLIIGYGSGQNGKGVLLQTLRRLLGDYAVRTPSETFLTRKNDGIPNDIAQLRGARFVFASETNEGRRLGEATIKDLTGGEDISARFMRGEWFSFTPTFTPWLATNHRPEIKGTDHAVWDRIALVPFEVRIPEDQQDKTLAEKLEQELSGILAWLIEGAAEWFSAGFGVPDEVRDATSGYRREMDTLGDFLEERCILDPQAWVLAGKLYESYTEWIEAAGERPMSQKVLGLRLKERGFKATRYGPKQARTWSGLRFRTEDDPPQTGSDATDGSDTESPFANGGEKSHVENGDSVSDPSYPSEPAVCDTDGCMNEAPGPGLHCDSCLNADAAEEVPF